jgi:hypothetical protein
MLRRIALIVVLLAALFRSFSVTLRPTEPQLSNAADNRSHSERLAGEPDVTAARLGIAAQTNVAFSANFTCGRADRPFVRVPGIESASAISSVPLNEST